MLYEILLLPNERISDEKRGQRDPCGRTLLRRSRFPSRRVDDLERVAEFLSKLGSLLRLYDRGREPLGRD